jgi:hypothetical protein
MKKLLITKPDGSKHLAMLGVLKDILKNDSLLSPDKRATIQEVEVDKKDAVVKVIRTLSESKAQVQAKNLQNISSKAEELEEKNAKLQEEIRIKDEQLAELLAKQNISPTPPSEPVKDDEQEQEQKISASNGRSRSNKNK